jgi:hypothetical protein
VPPIYQPELCAKIIVDASLDGRRAKLIGSWNKMIVLGAKFMPSVLGHYAARSGASSQQTDQPVSPDRPSNLFAPVDDHEDHGAHGTFGDRAGGVFDPSFTSALPSTLGTLGRSIVDAARDKVTGAAAMLTRG